MDTAGLKMFEAVARTGGMNRAAAELNTVQSNVTARIRALETELGCPLFERHSRGVALTAAGQRLLPYARRVAWLLTDAARAARAAEHRLAGDHGGAAPVTADRQLRRRLPRGRYRPAPGHHRGTHRVRAGPKAGGRVRLRPGGAPGAGRAGDVRGGAGNPGRPRPGLGGSGDARRHRADRRAARRLLLPPAAGGASGAARHRGAATAGVRHA